jgi:hypothetical protein
MAFIEMGLVEMRDDVAAQRRTIDWSNAGEGMET